MLFIALVAAPFGFERATVAWRVGQDSAVAFIADSGKRVGIYLYDNGELVQRGLILDKKGWMVDMNLMEFSAQEGFFKTPEDLVNYWCTGDPVSERVVLGHGGAEAIKSGTEAYQGLACDAFKLVGEDTSHEGKLLRWRGLTLFYTFSQGDVIKEASLTRVDTLSEIPEEKLSLPEGIFLTR